MLWVTQLELSEPEIYATLRLRKLRSEDQNLKLILIGEEYLGNRLRLFVEENNRESQ